MAGSTGLDRLAAAAARLSSEGAQNNASERQGEDTMRQAGAAQVGDMDTFVTPDGRTAGQAGQLGRQQAGTGGAGQHAMTRQLFETPVAGDRGGGQEQRNHNTPTPGEEVQAQQGGQNWQAGRHQAGAVRGVLAAAQEAANKLTKEQVAQAFRWQQEIGGDKDKVKEFQEEVVNTSHTIMAFAIAQKKSPVLKVVHGVTKYYNGDVAKEYKGRYMGRVGERTAMGEPHIVLLPEQSTWKWQEVQMHSDSEAWKTHALAEQTKYQLWKPTGGETMSIRLPRVLYLPPPLAVYLLEEDRTAAEAFQRLEELIGEENSGVEAADASLACAWFIAAGQKTPGGDTQALPVELAPLLSHEMEFVMWAQQQLCRYIGQRELETPQQRRGAAETLGGEQNNNSTTLDRVAMALTSLATTQAKNKEAGAKKVEETKPYDVYDMAVLMGFCGTDNPEEIPSIWREIKLAKKHYNVRAIIMRQMDLFARENRIELAAGVFLTKQVVEDIINITPNETGVVGVAVASGRGVSNLVVLPRNQAEIEALIRLEEATSSTEFTRTLEEAKKIAKAEARAPPRTFGTVKLNLATYAALLNVLFGDRCELYEKVWTLYGIMKEQEVAATAAGYRPMLCKEITWCVYDDSRSFFARRLLPVDFEDLSKAEVPRSLLGAVYKNVRYGERIKRLTFPVEWMEYEKAEQNQQQGSGRGKGSQNQFGGGGNYASEFGGYEQRGGYGGFNQYQPPAGTDYKHVQADIKAALTPIYDNDKFGGKFSVQRVLTLAGASMTDMPSWDRFPNNDFCWAWGLGSCKWGNQCKFSHTHVDGTLMPKEVAIKAVEVLKPGIEKMMSSSYNGEGGRQGQAGRGGGAGRGFGSGRGYGSGTGGRSGYAGQNGGFKRQRQW